MKDDTHEMPFVYDLYYSKQALKEICSHYNPEEKICRTFFEGKEYTHVWREGQEKPNFPDQILIQKRIRVCYDTRITRTHIPARDILAEIEEVTPDN